MKLRAHMVPSGMTLTSVDIPELAWAKDGFWIDQDHKFTTDEDEYLFWIPPSQIAFVMNLEDTEG